MATWRSLAVALVGLALPAAAHAQTHLIKESVSADQCHHYRLAMSLTGTMKVAREGKSVALTLAANATHQFVERVLTAEAKELPRKVARHYESAQSTVQLDGDKQPRTLRPERRLVVAQRREGPPLCYSPAGPLTREELELVSEHFDTLSLTGLLPGKGVAVGEEWKPANATVQALCQFEGLVGQALTAKLEAVKDGAAVLRVTGTAQGIELGALAKVTIDATARYDLLTHRLTELEWKQKDERDQGPASPAVTVESTTTLKRERVDEPKELNEVSLVGVPAGLDVSEALTNLSYRDSKGRFELQYGRDWHLVGQSGDQVVLRLLDRGDFVAQATVTPWAKADAGKHSSADSFKQTMDQMPGWQAEAIVQDGEVPTRKDHWLYRVTARGEMEAVKVVQSCYLLAGPRGDQAVVTFTMKPAQLSKIGTRDITLVEGIAFPVKDQ